MRKIFIAVCTICVTLFTLSGCDFLLSSNQHKKVFDEIEAFFEQIDTSNITTNIALPTTSDKVPEAIISWSSNKQDVISNEGIVVIPKEDIEVQLTAFVEIEETVKKATFDVTVIGDGSGGDIDKKPVFTDIIDLSYIIGSSANIDYKHEITATDYNGNDITNSITIDTSKVDLTKEGKYAIIYSVTDSEGNKNSVTAYLTVVTAGEYDLIASIAAKAVGTNVEVRGVVTGITRIDTFFIQDYTGGIAIFSSEASHINGLVVGDEVVIKGVKSQWKSSSGSDINLDNQITITTITQVEKAYSIDAAELSTLNKNTLSSLEGKLVDVNGIYLTTNFNTTSSDLNIKITDKTNETNLFVNKSISGFSGIISKLTGVTTNHRIDLSNVIISSYRGEVQILCTNANQITITDPTPVDPSISYTISYYGFNNQLIGTESVYKNAKITGLSSELTTISGYRFSGWYTEEARTNSFDTSTLVTQNYNLYGKWVDSSSSGTYDGNYYDNSNLDLTGSALMTELYNLIKSGSTGTYSSGKSRSTVEKADTVSGYGVLLIYGRKGYQISYETGSNWNQEHVLPQSILKSAGHSSNTGDLHNLRACDYAINTERDNLKFAAGSGLAGKVSGGWYAGDEWIGDCARIILYMATRYPGFKVTDVMSESLLAKWNALDPVSDFEINRNEIIAKEQKNRNPYVDHPELVDAVLGTNEMKLKKTQNTWYADFYETLFELNIEYTIPSKNEYVIEA